MKLFHLWDQDEHVERNGRVDPPTLRGTFSSLDKLNAYLQTDYYKFTCDTRGITLTDTSNSVELGRDSPHGYDYSHHGTVYYTTATLDEE